MLFSRLQAARYRRPTVMFLIQRLVLRSARAHKSFRCVKICDLPVRPTFWLRYAIVHMLLLVKCDSHFFCSGLRLSRVRISTHIANLHCEKACTVRHILGLLCDLSKTFTSRIIIILMKFVGIDGHSAPTVFKSMPMSRFSQSSYHICKQILSEELCQFQVYLLHNPLLPLVVSRSKALLLHAETLSD